MECPDPKCREDILKQVAYLDKNHWIVSSRVDGTEKENIEQWNKMVRMELIMGEADKRINQIFTRINYILGGIAVSCILLAINAAIKIAG